MVTLKVKPSSTWNATHLPPEHLVSKVPGSSYFTFLLDLSKPVGFDPKPAKRNRKSGGGVLARGVQAMGQSGLAGLHERCVLRRVGGVSVSSPEEFEIAVVKRRVVCAMLRKADLEERVKHQKHQHQHQHQQPGGGARSPPPKTTGHHQHELYDKPLSAEEEQLLDNAAVMCAIGEPERLCIRRELLQSGDGVGTRGFCTVTYSDPAFDLERQLPCDFDAFQSTATLLPFDPFWASYDHVLSRFKSSTRHFEAVAIARKITIVVLSIFLDHSHPKTQASAMLVVCCVALVLQLRLRPYDDENVMNDFNTADAVLFNNDLEAVLLALQVGHLLVALLTIYTDHSLLPTALVAALYLLLLALAICFALVALSTKFAKVAYRVLQKVWRLLPSCKGLVASGAAGGGGNQELLQAGRDVEMSKKASFQAEQAAIFEHITHETSATTHRQNALKAHRTKLLEDKEALTRGRNAWEKRRRKMRNENGGVLATATDNVGRLSSDTKSTQLRKEADAAARKQREASSNDARLTREREAFLKRMRKQKEKKKQQQQEQEEEEEALGGGVATVNL